jgi:hypothetical protein
MINGLTSRRFSFLCLIVVAFVFDACTHSVQLQRLVPAEITVPSHFKRIGVINRSVVNDKQSNKDKALNILEGVMTGEGIGEDRNASEECINGLMNIVQTQQRTVYVRLFDTDLEGTGRTMGKNIIPWSEVDKICKKSNLDGILVLEAFDSDARLDMIAGTVKVKTSDGKYADVPEFTANARMNVTTTWRIYDNVNRALFDQVNHYQEKGFGAKGSSESAARSALPNKRMMTMQTGLEAGQRFGRRISPNWVSYTRQIYKGKSDHMKHAYKLAKHNNWDKAADFWKKESELGTVKDRGRACYNMALVCEQEGKIDLAMEWCAKSRDRYKFKPAMSYYSNLSFIKSEEQRLKKQMGE